MCEGKATNRLVSFCQGLIAYAIHPGGVKTEVALNMRQEMHASLQDEPQLGADTLVWLTRERKEW